MPGLNTDPAAGIRAENTGFRHGILRQNGGIRQAGQQ